MSAKKEAKDAARGRQCSVCSEWYIPSTAINHFKECIIKNPSAYRESENYVVCPDCGAMSENLVSHMKMVHNWDKEKFKEYSKTGKRIISKSCSLKWKKAIYLKYGTNHHWNNPEVIEKRRQTWRNKYGCDNPFGSPEVQAQILSTNQERYGCDHPMQNEEVFARQNVSAQKGKSSLEEFFDAHTCDNVVFTGYGGRVVRTKTGVRKFGKVQHDLCPDFMVFPDGIVADAKELSANSLPMSQRWKYNTKYVVELFGDYYHSEKMLRISNAEHSKQVIDAYKSIGIECLVLWEHEVMQDWERTRPMVDAWINNAVQQMNNRPENKGRTRERTDRRKAGFVCPYGSGETFKTEQALNEWIISSDNLYRPNVVPDLDYVVCQMCSKRFKKLMRHVRKEHGISKEEYKVRFSAAKLISIRDSIRISNENKTKEKKGSYTKRSFYRLPDGTIARKKDKWMRMWNGNPPADSIIQGNSIII